MSELSDRKTQMASVPMAELATLIKERERYRALLEEALPFVGWQADMHELVERIRAALDEEDVT